jgi:hypothetical protein
VETLIDKNETIAGDKDDGSKAVDNSIVEKNVSNEVSTRSSGSVSITKTSKKRVKRNAPAKIGLSDETVEKIAQYGMGTDFKIEKKEEVK